MAKAMKQATLCYCLKGNQVLLGMKQRGFGEGKWNGGGGKPMYSGETMRMVTRRELREEFGIETKVSDFTQVALIRFYFMGEPKFECHVFTITRWTGEPIETEEMKPQWFNLDQIPYHDMWAADSSWLPLILGGMKIEATVDFADPEGLTVGKFEYKQRRFN